MIMDQLEESRMVYDLADDLAVRVLDAPLDRLRAEERARVHDAAAIAVRMLRPAWVAVARERVTEVTPDAVEQTSLTYAVETFLGVLSGKLLLTDEEQATIDEGDA